MATLVRQSMYIRLDIITTLFPKVIINALCIGIPQMQIQCLKLFIVSLNVFSCFIMTYYQGYS